MSKSVAKKGGFGTPGEYARYGMDDLLLAGVSSS
jgi:hypothetical protein